MPSSMKMSVFGSLHNSVWISKKKNWKSKILNSELVHLARMYGSAYSSIDLFLFHFIDSKIFNYSLIFAKKPNPVWLVIVAWKEFIQNQRSADPFKDGSKMRGTFGDFLIVMFAVFHLKCSLFWMNTYVETVHHSATV